MTDLAEFVGEYLAIDATEPVTAEEIAQAFLETTGGDGPPTAALLADIAYYAPELSRAHDVDADVDRFREEAW
jgi:hypothetical protein